MIFVSSERAYGTFY